MCGFLSLSWLSSPHPQCLLVTDIRSIHKGSCIEALEHKPPWKVSVFFYIVSWVLKANVNQEILCSGMMWKNSGSFFIICLILNLSLGCIVTNLGKFICYYLKSCWLPSSLFLRYAKCNFDLIIHFLALACL